MLFYKQEFTCIFVTRLLFIRLKLNQSAYDFKHFLFCHKLLTSKITKLFANYLKNMHSENSYFKDHPDTSNRNRSKLE